MSKKDEITKSVFEMYQQYPFPDINYKMNYSLSLMKFFIKEKPKSILEAGCGTGNTLIQLAKNFKDKNFVGIDMTTNSIRIAKENSKNLKNISFYEGNILDMELKQKFNVVMCIGVLHHLSDMKKGLNSLINRMEDGGYLILWLYGKYGRFRLNLNQRMFSILLKDADLLKEKVALAKRVLSKAPSKYLQCHFNVPYSKIEDDWDESIKFLMKHDNWIVDQFLHYNEKVVSMDDIFNLIEPAGLEFVKWLNVPLDLKSYINDEELNNMYNKLPLKDRLIVLDNLIKPKYYFIILKKKNAL